MFINFSKCSVLYKYVCTLDYFSIFCRVCPIFQVSNVTGHNLNLLKSFIGLLSARMHYNEDKPAEFQIDETYSVPVSPHLRTHLHFIIFRESKCT